MTEIRASTIASFFDEHTTLMVNNELMWDFLTKKRISFPFKTDILYFAHGNIFEPEAMHYFLTMCPSLKGYTPQKVVEHAYNEYEKNYATYLQRASFVHEPQEGVDTAKYYGIQNIILSSRPDGLTDTHVIELKCPFGSMYQKNETFVIPTKYKLQLVVEMLCHKRKSAYFLQYYEPKGWTMFIRELVVQYKTLRNTGDLKPQCVVYKPWRSTREHVLNIIKQVKKKLGVSVDTSAAERWEKYLLDFGEIEIGDEETIPFDKKYRDIFMHTIRMTSPERLKPYFNMLETEIIMHTLSFGQDFKRGTLINIDDGCMTIMWEGRPNHFDNYREKMSIQRFLDGYLHIVRSLNQSIKRKSESWYAWEKELYGNQLSEMPKLGYQEAVLCEMHLPQDLSPLEEFLDDLHLRKVPVGSMRMPSLEKLRKLLIDIPVETIEHISVDRDGVSPASGYSHPVTSKAVVKLEHTTNVAGASL
jgi:hypothetical protein